ncbi:hypothetical protein ACFYPN_32505 [Streptomyces sp. NPDC005576]|uniref:hypothetical protein n=1 Tax=Streptomyces sp. NPDC005576 TaxID=3364726 RepID=UPI0036A782C0
MALDKKISITPRPASAPSNGDRYESDYCASRGGWVSGPAKPVAGTPKGGK